MQMQLAVKACDMHTRHMMHGSRRLLAGAVLDRECEGLLTCAVLPEKAMSAPTPDAGLVTCKGQGGHKPAVP